MCRMPFLTPKPLVKYKSGVAGHIMPPHTCNDLTSHAFIADHAPTLDYVQRSCSSLYRLPRFINCPTYITLHYNRRPSLKLVGDTLSVSAWTNLSQILAIEAESVYRTGVFLSGPLECLPDYNRVRDGMWWYRM